jgi:hypothetical protein
MWVLCGVVGGVGVNHPISDGCGGSVLHSAEGVDEVMWISHPRPQHPGLQLRWQAWGRAVVPEEV